MPAQEDYLKEIDWSPLSVIPLGGQSELGQVLWAIVYQGQMLIIDAGAAYPTSILPGVDLLVPNTSFLEANQARICALLLTNGNEEYIGAVPYLVEHIKVPKIMAGKFVASLLEQIRHDLPVKHVLKTLNIQTVNLKQEYKIGPFTVEWIRVNDVVAEASALRISTDKGEILYITSFKLDQTPVDKQIADINRLAELGDKGVLLLIGPSAGVEKTGYSESEMVLYERLYSRIERAAGRVIVLMAGTSTHRLQILFQVAKECNRKTLLLGDVLMRSAVAAAMTGNLIIDHEREINLEALNNYPDRDVLIIATGKEGNAMPLLADLANGTYENLSTRSGDTIIFSADIQPGRLRQMAMLLDHFLLSDVKIYWGEDQGVHVTRNASQEELKLMLSMIRPDHFIPAFGEGRHIMHHAKLACELGMSEADIFPLCNGQVLTYKNDSTEIIGRIENQAVLINRDQGERVTTFTVNERRVMSQEGLITISLVMDDNGKLISGPKFDSGAASFRYSNQWEDTCLEIGENIKAAINKEITIEGKKTSDSLQTAIRALVRDIAFKTLRARLQKKPVLQIIIQQVSTKHLQYK